MHTRLKRCVDVVAGSSKVQKKLDPWSAEGLVIVHAWRVKLVFGRDGGGNHTTDSQGEGDEGEPSGRTLTAC